MLLVYIENRNIKIDNKNIKTFFKICGLWLIDLFFIKGWFSKSLTEEFLKNFSSSKPE